MVDLIKLIFSIYFLIVIVCINAVLLRVLKCQEFTPGSY